jgi:dienelactone hydrolase
VAAVEPVPGPQAKQVTEKKEVTIQLLMADPVTAVAEVTKAAIKQLQESASLFVAAFGGGLMVYAALDVTLLARHGFDRLSSAEFLQLLILGFVLLLAGAGFRMFLGYEQGKAEQTFQVWLRERASKEADAQIERASAAQEAATERGAEIPPPEQVKP